jgi:hypothetical protein
VAVYKSIIFNMVLAPKPSKHRLLLDRGSTPLMPDLGVATNIMRQKMAKGKEKEMGQAGVIEIG